MRRLARAGLLASALLAGASIVSPAWSQHDDHGAAPHGDDHGAAAAHGGHAACEADAVCEAGSSEHDCECYWATNINWFNWDYKSTVDQAPEHRHMPPPFGFALINFAVFAAVMYRLAATPLRDFVRARHTTIRKDLDDARTLHSEAEARLRAYEAKIAGLDAEIDALLAQVKREAETEKSRIIASAEEQARRLKAEAERQIRDAIERARRELKAETVAAAVASAEKMLAQQSTPDDGVRLAERFVASLETGADLGALPGAAPTRARS